MAFKLILFALTLLMVDANDYCKMRSLCPRNEHLGCSFDENSWSTVRSGPVPLKRSSGIDDNDRQLILGVHNDLRRSVAKGENDTQNPPRTISNMRELEWSEELAYLARIRVTLFNLGRSGSDCANLPKYNVGMNQYMQSYPAAPADSTPWDLVTKYWFSYSRFVASGLMSDLGAFRDLAQFAQMLWPTTYEVGCASNNFAMPGAYMRNIICFYGPVAKCYDNQQPFTPGQPASNCTDGTVPKDGLCGFVRTAETTPASTTTSTTQEITTPSTTTSTEPTTTTTTEPSINIIDQEITTPSTTTTEPSTTTSTTQEITTPSTTTTEPSTTTSTTQEITTPSTTTTEPTTTTTTTTTIEPNNQPNSINQPCNSTTTTMPVDVPKDPKEILISVLRYVCQLLSISPPEALLAQMANLTTPA